MSAQQDVDRQGRSRTADDLRERLLAGLPVTERRLAVAGVSTAVLEGGHGPPVVFLQAEFAAVWMRVIPELVRTHRVIAPDLPGLGASQVSNGPPGVDTVLTWVGELIEQTCPTPPVLRGQGGRRRHRRPIRGRPQRPAAGVGAGGHLRAGAIPTGARAGTHLRRRHVATDRTRTGTRLSQLLLRRPRSACAARWASAGKRWRRTPWIVSAPRLSGLPCGASWDRWRRRSRRTIWPGSPFRRPSSGDGTIAECG